MVPAITSALQLVLVAQSLKRPPVTLVQHVTAAHRLLSALLPKCQAGMLPCATCMEVHLREANMEGQGDDRASKTVPAQYYCSALSAPAACQHSTTWHAC